MKRGQIRGLCMLGAVLMLHILPQTLGARPHVSDPRASEQPPPDEVQRGPMQSLRVVRSDPEWRGVAASLDQVVRRIEFQNVLSVSVSIEVVQRSCGCMQADLSSASVEPGGYVTLTLAAHAAPGFGTQTQTVVFRARWKDEREDRSERGVCSMSFGCETQVLVRPEAAVVVAIQGESARALFFVRSPDGVDLPAPQPSCSIPGWTASVVARPAEAHEPWVFCASGPAFGAGEHAGEVDLWEATAGFGSVKVPIRVRVLPAWVCEPAVVRLNQDKPVAHVRLAPRASGALAPARAQASNEGLVAQLTGGTVLEVRLTKATPGISAGWIDVLDASGDSIARLPVIIGP